MTNMNALILDPLRIEVYTRAHMEEQMMHLLGPHHPAKFRAWLRSLPFDLLAEEYHKVLEDLHIEEAA